LCFTGAETEIDKIKDDSKINRETNIDRRGQRHIVNVWQLSDHPLLSRYRLPLTPLCLIMQKDSVRQLAMRNIKEIKKNMDLMAAFRLFGRTLSINLALL